MPRILSFQIAPDGKTTIEASGYVGTACRDATRPFEEALGGTAEVVREKPEMRQQAATGVANRADLGGPR